MSLNPVVLGFSSLPGNAFDPFSAFLDVCHPFDGFPFGRSLLSLARPLAGERSDLIGASVDWKETPEAHIFKADLPGLKKEEVKVEVDGEVLEIRGERRSEKQVKTDTWHCMERGNGLFVRRFRMPGNAKVENVKATMEDGVLTVTVSKDESKKVEVKSIEISD